MRIYYTNNNFLELGEVSPFSFKQLKSRDIYPYLDIHAWTFKLILYFHYIPDCLVVMFSSFLL